MSIAEMKLAAINEISKLEDEKAIKEILEHLAKISLTKEDKVLNLSEHYNNVKEQYGNVLKRLAL
jgi:predicted Zn-ribbon and HTH transcriptional regulator